MRKLMNKELDGKWKVTVSNMMCSVSCVAGNPLNLLHDVKVIQDGEGYNIIGIHKWGFFTVDALDHGLFCLNYCHEGNPPFLLGVRDYMVRTSQGWKGTLERDGEERFKFRLEPAEAIDEYCVDGCMEDSGKCNLEVSGFCGVACPRDAEKCGLWYAR